MLDFEPYIQSYLQLAVERWDRHCDNAAKTEVDGRWTVDSLLWFNYLAFDTISDLCFGEPFGMTDKEADITVIKKEDGTVVYMPAIQILNERGDYAASLGVIRPWLRPFAKVSALVDFSGHACVLTFLESSDCRSMVQER